MFQQVPSIIHSIPWEPVFQPYTSLNIADPAVEATKPKLGSILTSYCGFAFKRELYGSVGRPPKGATLFSACGEAIDNPPYI